MQLVDRIEKRRFVGREFLLFLWFESELFDATLQTREQGPFGLWLERRLVLSDGGESTRITAPMPGLGREAKEALLRGQLPESAGIRIAFQDDETSLQLNADTLGIAALKLRTVLAKEQAAPNDLVTEMAGGTRAKRGRAKKDAAEEPHEIFYERMYMAGELEGLIETLFRDFVALRLSSAWCEVVTPLMRAWVNGIDAAELDVSAYEALRRPSVRTVSQARELERRPAPAAPDEAPLETEVTAVAE